MLNPLIFDFFEKAWQVQTWILSGMAAKELAMEKARGLMGGNKSNRYSRGMLGTVFSCNRERLESQHLTVLDLFNKFTTVKNPLKLRSVKKFFIYSPLWFMKR